MNFGFTEEQELLRQEVRKFLDEQCPIDEVRRIAETPDGYSSELWKQLAELGWLGLVIPNRYGGSNLGWEELVVMLEETGRSLFPSPLISTTLAAATILDVGNEKQRERWLPRLADGSCIATTALLEENQDLAPSGVQLRSERTADGGFVLHGQKHFVPDAAQADLVILAFRSGEADEDVTLVRRHAAIIRCRRGPCASILRFVGEAFQCRFLRSNNSRAARRR